MTIARPSRETLLEVLVLSVLAWLAAVGMTGVLRLALPDPALETTPIGDGPDDPAALEPLDAFHSIATRDVFNGGTAARTGPPPSLRLWGVGMNGTDAYAVLEDTSTGQQTLHRVGDDLGGSRLAAIAWDHVTLHGPDGDQTLPLSTEPPTTEADTAARQVPPPAPASQVRQTGPNSFIVDRTALMGAVDNTSGLLTQLRAVPEVADGRPLGFRLFQINPESVFARLGIRNGDVVQRVNGTTLADPASLLGFLQRLRNEPRVALDIMRAGEPRTLVYDLR